MDRLRFLENPVQHYDWGSHTAIAELTGRPAPTGEPEAELWMGAHRKAPSSVRADDGTVPLDRWIRRDPERILGPEVASRYEGRLPFLFKVLAARMPLSIQAHPDADQAREGFARENKRGLDPSAPERNYRDPNHKPELICALSEFWAMNGFRSGSAMLRLAEELDVAALGRLLEPLERDETRIADVFGRLMDLDGEERARLLGPAVDRARRLCDRNAAFEWMVRLSEHFAGDPGLLSPLLLNVVKLEPGQSMFLPARRLHAYLGGTGMEIMASSDNVLRGGLTNKHVDVPELMHVLDFEPSDPDVRGPLRGGPALDEYPCAAEEFTLSVVRVRPGVSHRSAGAGRAAILLCTVGRARVFTAEQRLEMDRGRCLWVPAGAPDYTVEGEATVYCGSVGDQRRS
jgi:mannose-6-phosphate isomerase